MGTARCPSGHQDAIAPQSNMCLHGVGKTALKFNCGFRHDQEIGLIEFRKALL